VAFETIWGPKRKHNGFVNVRVEGLGGEEFVKFEILMPDVALTHRKSAGYELIARWQSHEISSGEEFFTDSNSLELIQRHRQTGKDYQDAPASYYPVTSMIGINDDR